MKIAIGADHGGFTLKKEIDSFLQAQGHQVLDFGTFSGESCDYPEFAHKVSQAVSGKKVDAGILICKSGNGMAIVANKFPGVRAAICFDKNVAALSRQHNDANILVLGSEHLFDEPETIIKEWLSANFEGGRHKRRVEQILRIENKICSKATPKKQLKKKAKKRK